MDLTPALVLSMWAAGIAAAAAAVAWWAIVGRGFVRLSGIVIAGLSAAAAASGGGLPAWIAALLALVSLVVASRPAAMATFGSASVLLVLAAAADSPTLPAVSGAVFLGGITAEMLLGHWYLVDPQLPRWALQALAIGAGSGFVVDATYVMAKGALDWGAGDEVLGWAFLGLSAMSAVLIVAVSFSLREPSYTGVMAATGLSYLAVLTAFGVVVLGRLLAF